MRKLDPPFLHPDPDAKSRIRRRKRFAVVGVWFFIGVGMHWGPALLDALGIPMVRAPLSGILGPDMQPWLVAFGPLLWAVMGFLLVRIVELAQESKERAGS